MTVIEVLLLALILVVAVIGYMIVRAIEEVAEEISKDKTHDYR